MVSGTCTCTQRLSCVWLCMCNCMASAVYLAVHAHRDHFSQLVSGIRKRKLAERQQSDDSTIGIGCEEADEDESEDDSRDPDFLPGKRMRT